MTSSRTTHRGQRTLAGSAALGLATMAVAPAAMAANLMDFNQSGQLPLGARQFTQGACPAQPEGEDGWHFVAPSGEFTSLHAVFDVDGDLESSDDRVVRTLEDAVRHPGPAHAYVYAPGGALLIEADASGTASNGFFVLSHTCAVDPEESGGETSGGGTGGGTGETGGSTGGGETGGSGTGGSTEGGTGGGETGGSTEGGTGTGETGGSTEGDTGGSETGGSTEGGTGGSETGTAPEVDEDQTQGDGVDTDEESATDGVEDEAREESEEELAQTGASLTAAVLGGALLAGGAGLTLAARRHT
jgi:LPXTG-motif cell wall-anchored protein